MASNLLVLDMVLFEVLFVHVAGFPFPQAFGKRFFRGPRTSWQPRCNTQRSTRCPVAKLLVQFTSQNVDS